MIRYVVTARFSSTIRGLIKGLGRDARDLLSYITYEELFFESAAPISHYIFTDFDRLSRYEMDCAAALSLALEREAPAVRILNHPLKVRERVSLLRHLYCEGFNVFDVCRLDTGERPTRFPVFIRAEDGYGGPETGIIRDEAELKDSLRRLAERGLPLKGRIAVGYIGEEGEDGFHRKYGAFNIGGVIVPQHLMCGDGWVVKKNSARIGEAAVEEELRYVRENPHEERLRQAFEHANIDFGRVDYGFYAGRLQIYEINTNPSFPKFYKSDSRSERRRLIRERLVRALRNINTPHPTGRVGFAMARPRAHSLRLPGLRLPASLARRVRDGLTRPSDDQEDT